MKLYRIEGNTLYRTDGTKLFEFTSYLQTDDNGTEFVNGDASMRVTTRRIENLPPASAKSDENPLKTADEAPKKPAKPRKTKQTTNS